MRGSALRHVNHFHESVFVLGEGATVDIVLTWFPSHQSAPDPLDVDGQIKCTTAWWRDWASTSKPDVMYAVAVKRSLLVLRALTHEDTGGIVAAVTTSLPKQFGGSRNWDYRHSWIRDASLAPSAPMLYGHGNEAGQWRHWLLRAIAGDPADIQIMYGLSGERRLTEQELTSLPGFNGAAPGHDLHVVVHHDKEVRHGIPGVAVRSSAGRPRAVSPERARRRVLAPKVALWGLNRASGN